MTEAKPVVLEGRGRLLPAATDSAAHVTFEDDGFTLAIGSESRLPAYRDVATIAVQAGAVLLVLGTGPGSERVLLSQFGQAQGGLIAGLRERRLRQWLGDALVEHPEEPYELVEYVAGAQGEEHGVGLLAYHPWGAILSPIDERLPWLRLRRGEIGSVAFDERQGTVVVTAAADAGRSSRIELPGLGERARLHNDRLTALRRGAQEDAARLVGRLMPDAEYGIRQEAARAIVDGRPARPADLPNAWPVVEAAVLTEPTFAASYQGLVAKAGPAAAERVIAMAPTQPGGDDVKSWFFVPLPGNLVALELVSEGAHATYCFRALPRARFTGGPTPSDAARATVLDVTEALIDSRFLREPMALPEDQLRLPAYLRYRLALRALPSLAAARARFVARIVHRDDASWSAAIDNLIAWHDAARHDGAVWPGRAAQESMVSEAGAGDSDGDAPSAGEPAQPQLAGGS
jgi:hypothetical protein